MPRILILIAVIMLMAALWVVKPFKGMYDPVEVELPPTDTRVAVERTYGPPHSVQAGAAYRKARAKRIMRPASTYPTHIADRYYAELDLYMRKMSGEKDGQMLFPSASMLRNMEVHGASEKDCDNPRSRYNNPVEFRGLTLYMDGYIKKNQCEWSTTHYAKYFKRFQNRQTKVEVSACSWELLVPDTAVLDMAHLYQYEPNAADQ